MKQIITLLIFILAFTINSYAVTSTVNSNSNEAITLSKKSNTTFLSKARVFVNRTIIKAKKLIAEDDETLLIILGIVIPPLALYLYEGKVWTNRVTLNLVIWVLTWWFFGLAGIIHALHIILNKK